MYQAIVRHDGSINIPANLRERLQIRPGTTFEVHAGPGGKLTYTALSEKCSICGAKVRVVDSTMDACPFCHEILTHLVRDGMSISAAIKHMRRERRCKNI